jgi:hypothetical protein
MALYDTLIHDIKQCAENDCTNCSRKVVDNCVDKVLRDAAGALEYMQRERELAMSGTYNRETDATITSGYIQIEDDKTTNKYQTTTATTSTVTNNSYRYYCTYRLPCGICTRTDSYCPLTHTLPDITWSTPTITCTSTGSGGYDSVTIGDTAKTK